jgi:acyl-CoA dehydrogenase
VVCDWIAESRVRLEQLRLLVLKTAWLMDTAGNKGAHTEIQVIKIATPATVQRVPGKAIQVHGAGGLSQDFPLANAYANIRGLRFAGGPTRSTRTRWRTVSCAVRPRLTDRR